ncbi:RusA family crossover junction endodeoxyribonuclease [Clostridium botulinum]|uniref:RusA family crossover junction endodeoxyribonuclease n=1 Tax=Clostridium botulinum TaxID=1491 RepID=UPI0005F8F916|nr:RusA family crossover junction endodeoxyribonuclease [Clostridium botulinum]MBY6800142.1 RusA family crossover junction endodeoxyribonuclease [Clostridium botulinum]NFF20635.1 RusA family crossover junction endodeoxyribonuclease [Clostridium botulinum]NFM74758.1 RusA family crossover junction endodeoxyribonuclease [Clostridium botulinum]NFP79379.1 RusA family crossover junction endodeoxyribonuclease [Clostridium botulinum]NFP93562.1 RusA family crossover junction endodeoxyribonuclease [Clos
MKIVIDGKPMGKQRPRFNGKTGRAYTADKTIIYENWVKLCYQQQCAGEKLTGKITANIMAYYPIPKNTSKIKKHYMLLGIERPTKKPDIDNIAKIVLDSLNNLAYRDDKQVVSCCISKWYSENPRVTVELEEV